MEIIKSHKIAFAYTVKTLFLHDDYSNFFEHLEKFKVHVEYKVGELDSKGKLHYHGILYLDKGFYRKRLMIRKFHIKLVEIFDKSGWIKYIHKDCEFHSLEQMAEDRLTVVTGPDSPVFKIPAKSMFK